MGKPPIWYSYSENPGFNAKFIVALQDDTPSVVTIALSMCER